MSDDSLLDSPMKRIKLNNGKESPVDNNNKEQHTFDVLDSLIVSKHNYDQCSGPAEKVAAFDMDWTLIRVKSGGKFAKNAYDWAWWHESVPAKL
mmetsp:Transcript_12415/g.17161  ORF Transcript_12415/g.17161 Transcript_12415/m.17161 type:complete len:94 (+) Transcript_12415:91-372(+)